MKKELLKKGEFYILSPDNRKLGCIIYDKFDVKTNKFYFYFAVNQNKAVPPTVTLGISEMNNLKKYRRSKDKGKVVKNIIPLFTVPKGSIWTVKDNSYEYLGEEVQIYIAKNKETSKYFDK